MSIRRAAGGVCVSMLLCAVVWCASAHAQDLSVELDPSNSDWMRRDQAIRLILNRAPAADDGRLAIIVGDTDLTDLFAAYDAALEYRPSPIPLPPGEHEIAVFLVSAQGAWREIARLPIRVLTSAGFERRTFEPRLDLQGTNLLDERVEPDETAGASTQDEGSLNAYLSGDAERGGWRLAGRMHTLGVSEHANALRFAQEGERAPRVDLADYSVRLERTGEQRGFFELGHVAYNQHRYLIPSFSSRGTAFGVPLGTAGAARFAAMNGTSLVGWNNFTGLANNDHRVIATNVGFELRPARPGALRIDMDYLSGSLLPMNNFNGGNIGDRQTNRGWGGRIAGAMPSGRLRFETGYARSAYRNPYDPTLAQGLTLVPVEQEERGARYADINWDILQGKVFGEQRVANLSLSLRHERIDPQYASVAAGLQADMMSNVAQLGGTIGPLQLQVTYGETEDNLDDIESILTTHTRRTDAMLALPLADLFFPARSASWLPVAAYTFGRVHQFGAGVPVNSGFAEAHVPDQVSGRHGLTLDWRSARWSAGYRFDYSLQDNRQVGREQADFATLVHAANVAFAPLPQLDLNLELSRERSYAEELDRVTRTYNAGFGLRLHATRMLHFSGTAGLTHSADDPRTNDSESTFLDLALTYRLEWQTTTGRGISGQMFVRYSDRAQSSRDQVFGFDLDNRMRTVVGGITLGLR